MYCPSCGSEERQLSQYCRACGTDLRSVRKGLEMPDTITASAVSAREQISQAFADKIRQMESATDLQRMAGTVLPQLEEFLESPVEKRLRRVRAGVITAAIGLGASLLILFASLNVQDLAPFVGLGLILFFVGLGLIINGFFFTVPLKGLIDRTEEAEAQRELESETQHLRGPQQLMNGSKATDPLAGRSSVTEHTTHQLGPDKF